VRGLILKEGKDPKKVCAKFKISDTLARRICCGPLVRHGSGIERSYG